MKFDDHSFGLCLTHDVDRPYKTYQALYYALQENPAYHLKSVLPSENPYWQFEEVMALEDELGVRSSFYFLNEPHLVRSKHPKRWLSPQNWVEHFGRYDVTADEIVDIIHELNAGGWEVGLHGSYHSYDDVDQLRTEKRRLEGIVGHELTGIRQHHLNLERPDTWRHHANLGFKYDASLGSSSTYGFQHGYGVQRPFDDEFVVFPLTLMEVALPDVDSEFQLAWRECKRLLGEAAANGAVMSVLWHPMYFSEEDFPGYKRLYRKLIEEALEMDAWVGAPGDFYTEFQLADASTSADIQQ